MGAKSPVTKQEETTRQKRSADAEAEADPAKVYTSNIDSSMSNTAMNYRYTGLPASFSTYNYPQTQNIATIPYTGFTPSTRMWSYSSMTPYSSFSWMNPSQYTGVSRARRSAEPEADPQELTTGFSYPAITLTGTSPQPTILVSPPLTVLDSHSSMETSQQPLASSTDKWWCLECLRKTYKYGVPF